MLVKVSSSSGCLGRLEVSKVWEPRKRRESIREAGSVPMRPDEGSPRRLVRVEEKVGKTDRAGMVEGAWKSMLDAIVAQRRWRQPGRESGTSEAEEGRSSGFSLLRSSGSASVLTSSSDVR